MNWRLGLLAACLLAGGIIFIGCSDDSTGPEANASPVILALRADRDRITSDTPVGIRCLATDKDGDVLSYTWGATSGTVELTSRPDSISWLAPEDSHTASISVSVSDGQDVTGDSLSVLVCNQVIIFPSEPAVSQARADSTNVRFNWNSYQHVAWMMQVERKLTSQADADYDTLATVSFHDGIYTDSSIAPGSIYDYRFSVIYCGGVSPGKVIQVDREWPQIAQSLPVDGGTGFPVDGIVELEFSEPLDTQATRIEVWSTHNINAIVELAEDGQIARVIHPNTEIGYGLNEEYTCRVTAVDTAGNTSHLELSFSTYLEKIAFGKTVLEVAYELENHSAVFLTTNSIDRFNFQTKTFDQSAPLGFNPTNFARNPEDGYYYVTCSEDYNIHIIDLAAGSEVEVVGVLIADEHSPHPARNPRTIAFSENGTGLVEVHADGLSGGGHSIEQIKIVNSTVEMAYRTEFGGGAAPALQIASANNNGCILLQESNSSMSDIFIYDQLADSIDFVRTNSGYLNNEIQGAPGRSYFMSNNSLLGCNAVILNTLGSFDAASHMRSFSNDMDLDDDRYYMGLRDYPAGFYFYRLDNTTFQGDRRHVALAGDFAVACLSGQLLILNDNGACLLDLEALSLSE